MSTDYIATIPINLQDRVGDFAIGVFTYEPFVPAKTWGDPEKMYPEEGGVGEWELLNCARPDNAIEAMLTSAEHDMINRAIFEHFEEGGYLS